MTFECRLFWILGKSLWESNLVGLLIDLEIESFFLL